MTIVITLPHFFDGEAERIVQLLRRGDVDVMHLRKPESARQEMEALIRAIPADLHGRLVVHDHHELAMAYALRGIHLNGRHPEAPAGYGGQLSVSCHSLAELAERKREPFAYLSLSPIFDSISKQGYRAAFTAEELERARQEGIIDRRVMALGGVTFDKLDAVRQMGFGGGMILGDAWR